MGPRTGSARFEKKEKIQFFCTPALGANLAQDRGRMESEITSLQAEVTHLKRQTEVRDLASAPAA